MWKRLGWVLGAPLALACGGGGTNERVAGNANDPAVSDVPSETPADDYTSYSVDYRDDAAIVDDLDGVQKALVRADYEQGELVFSSDFSGLPALEVGKAALLAGIGVFRVTGRETVDDGELVRVEAAPLTDVIENGSIRWRRSFVSAYAPARLGVGDDENEADNIGKLRQADTSFMDGKLHYSGVISNYTTTFDLTPADAGLDFALSAKFKVDDNNLFNAALSGTLHGLTHEADIEIIDETLESYDEHYYAVDGEVKFNAGAVQIGGKSKFSVPARLSLPVMVGPIPFHVDVGAGLEVDSSLTTNTSAIFNGSAKFKGSMAVKVNPDYSVDYQATFDTSDLAMDHAEQVAVVTSGLDVVLNFPEISVGVGVANVADASVFLRVKTEAISNATVTYAAAGPVPVITGTCIEAATNLGATYGGTATFLGKKVFEEEHQLYGKLGEKKTAGDGCK